MQPILSKTANAPQARRVALIPPEFLRSAGSRRIYVASQVVDYGLLAAATIEADLRRAHPETEFVFARGLYSGARNWLARWPAEQGSYGGIILLTFTAEAVIGLGMTKELLSFISEPNPRPALWLAYRRPKPVAHDRFVVVDYSPMRDLDCYARLFRDGQAARCRPENCVPLMGAAMTPARFILPGSRADFAERASGSPIYVTAQFDLRRPVLNAAVGELRREMAGAKIVLARGLYEDIADWERRFPTERTRYGGLIAVTAAISGPDFPGQVPARKQPFCGHGIPDPIASEIAAFVEMRRPVAWIGLEWPHMCWLSRFVVDARPPNGTWFVSNAAAAFLSLATDRPT